VLGGAVFFVYVPASGGLRVWAGFPPDLAAVDERLDRGDGRDAADAVSDGMVGALAAIGTAAEVTATIAEYEAAGATLPGVGPLATEGTASFEQTLAAVSGVDLRSAATGTE
jgi:hypothetical protein